MWHTKKCKHFLSFHIRSGRWPSIMFMINGQYEIWILIDFSLAQRLWLLFLWCHTVTHGTDLRRSPPLHMEFARTHFFLHYQHIVQCVQCPMQHFAFYSAHRLIGSTLDHYSTMQFKTTHTTHLIHTTRLTQCNSCNTKQCPLNF